MQTSTSGNSPTYSGVVTSLSRPVLGSVLLTLFCALLFTIGSDAIPVIDRDEARFAQASKQMLETGNFLEIFFQDQPRNKKPPLTHWLQSASAAAFGGEDLNRIGAYRLPSMLGAWLAVLATFLLGARWVGRPAAFLAATVLSASVGLLVEVNQAKSDALLLGFTTTALLALLPGLWSSELLDRRRALIGWAALGFAILTKGPIAPMVLALTIVAFVIFRAEAVRKLRNLRPLIGLGLATAIAAPWFIAIQLFGSSDFLGDALSEDLFSKVLTGQEAHGAPPGYYLLTSALLFFPGVVVLLPALTKARGELHRNDSAALLALLCWIVPTWLLFELIPTKLPHYVYPLYPALALLIGRYLWEMGAVARPIRFRAGLALAFLAALTVAVVGAWWYQPSIWPWLLVSLVGLLVFAGLVWLERNRSHMRFMVLATSISSISLFMIGEGIAPRLSTLWLSRSIEQAVAPLDVPPAEIGSAFHEPSLVFLLGTDITLGQGDQMVQDNRLELLILPVEPQPAGWKLARAIEGFNYSKGDPLVLGLFLRE